MCENSEHMLKNDDSMTKFLSFNKLEYLTILGAFSSCYLQELIKQQNI